MTNILLKLTIFSNGHSGMLLGRNLEKLEGLSNEEKIS
jgi:hypothetical protein